MSEMSTGHHHNPGRYEIRLKGHLDTRWAAWFDRAVPRPTTVTEPPLSMAP